VAWLLPFPSGGYDRCGRHGGGGQCSAEVAATPGAWRGRWLRLRAADSAWSRPWQSGDGGAGGFSARRRRRMHHDASCTGDESILDGDSGSAPPWWWGWGLADAC
jgi:hypothetical protein